MRSPEPERKPRVSERSEVLHDQKEHVIFNQPHGLTGIVGVDGILTNEQQAFLNRLQEETADEALTSLDMLKPGDPFPMIAMATGIGKSKIIHRVIERELRRKPDEKIVVVAGTKISLVDQTHQSLSGYISAEDDEHLISETLDPEENPLAGQRSRKYKTGTLDEEDVKVGIGTIQLLDSRVRGGKLNPKRTGLVIIDEGHNIGTHRRRKTISSFNRALAFTATPYRSSGSLKNPDSYGFKIIKSYSLADAQKDRLLPPLLGLSIDTTELVEEIPTGMTGKIDYGKLETLLKKNEALHPFMADRIARLIVGSEGQRYKTVVAVNYVWEAQKLAALLHEKGISVGIAVNKQAAKQLHTKEIPAKDSIAKYKLPGDDPNAVQVLISPYVASEGFDAPFTEILVWASPTDSALRYTQYNGRLGRRASGKKFGLVVDFLFQTSQFKWSYNMGMWMKGDVRQLPNGLLYLGSDEDIEELSNLPLLNEMTATRREADTKSLEDLQVEHISEVLPTDLLISRRGLASRFVAKTQTLLLEKALEIKTKLGSTNPEFFAVRKMGTSFVTVVTELGRAKFIELIKESGILERPKSIEPIKEGQIPLTGPSLTELFVGAERALAEIGNAFREREKNDHPEYFGEAYTGQNKIVSIITNDGIPALYAAMRQAEIQERSITPEPIKEGELPISQVSIRTRFRGDPHARIAKAIVAEWQETNPTGVVKRRVRSNEVDAIPEEKMEEFIRAMEQRGVRLK